MNTITANWLNDDIEQAKNPVTDTYGKEFLYVPLDKIIGNRDGKWEHQYLHEIDEAKKYYFSIPPIAVEKTKDGKFEFYDGFHRVNFCKKYELKVPAIIYTQKKKTHYHERMISCTTAMRYLVFNCDCEKDVQKSSLIKCKK